MQNLFENLQTLNENDPVTVICYGQESKWDNRQDAIDFYYQGMMACDGSEARRYMLVYDDLVSGKDVCTDEEDWI